MQCKSATKKAPKPDDFGAFDLIISGETGDHADGPGQDIADEANLALNEQTGVFVKYLVLDLLSNFLGIDLKKLACNAEKLACVEVLNGLNEVILRSLVVKIGYCLDAQVVFLPYNSLLFICSNYTTLSYIL